MNDIRFFSKPINQYAEETVAIEHSIQLPNITTETLAKHKKRTEDIMNELCLFDKRFSGIIERKRTIRTLNAEEETALTEFAEKRSKLIADLKTVLKKIEDHPLIQFTFCETKTPNVVSTGILQSTIVTVDETKSKKSKAPAKKDTKTKVDKEQEKQAKLLEKEQEKQTKLLEKAQEKQAKLLEKAREKEQEKQAKLLEKAREKEQEKQAKLLEKSQEKQAKLLEKAREKEQEKQAKLLEKEKEKQAKLLAKKSK